MTLPNVTLFPQAFLPLYIFEPRYRQMLEDALGSHRMFCVAMQRPGRMRETPVPIAGLGLIRFSVRHPDRTSHLVLQGLARVELQPALRYKPYRVHRIRPLATPPCDNVTVDALVAKMRELLIERSQLGLGFSSLPLTGSSKKDTLPDFSAKEVIRYLQTIADPAQAVDQVSCAVLPGALQRQTILETVSVEARLRRLIHFLLAEIRAKRKGNGT